MTLALITTPAQRFVIDAPFLPPCPAWCDSANDTSDETACWSHDIDKTWSASHTKDLGAEVAVTQFAHWSKATGLRLDPAEAMIGPAPIDGRSGSGELLLDADGVRSMMDALDRAQALLDEIKHTSSAQ